MSLRKSGSGLELVKGSPGGYQVSVVGRICGSGKF